MSRLSTKNQGETVRDLLIAVLLAGCSPPLAELVEVAENTTCVSNNDCFVTHSACSETAYCSHIEDAPETPDIVCDPARYSKPSADRCSCVDASCTVSEDAPE